MSATPRLVVDGHLDLAMNALGGERDLALAVSELRQREGNAWVKLRGTATVSLPEMRRGGVALCVTTVLARSKPWLPADRPLDRLNLDWPCQNMAYAIAQGQLAYYRVLQQQGLVRLIAHRQDLEAHWNRWTSKPSLAEPIGLILMMEGADPIVVPEQVHEWFACGLRCLSLAHFGHSAYAAGTPSPDPQSPEKDGPLTAAGRLLLAEMEKLPMALDLTHLGDTSFFEAIDSFRGPVCATHCNTRTLAPSVRQLSDEQIKLILERGGVIGAVLYNGMIRGTADQPLPREAISLRDLADHIDHICQLAGSSSHVGIGSDMDGGFGLEKVPRDVDTIADLQKIGPILAGRGYSDSDLDAIFHGNWIKFWGRVLPAKN
ncbi:MAG: membrane dipeptidase [Phycisphaeraceae bacterium]|nr:membrane dipeptidase [Phycisphaeraceae bacterium]